MKILLAVILCTIFLTSIIASSYAQNLNEPRYGGTFVIAVGTEDSNLNPGIEIEATKTSKIFSSLLQYDHDLNPRPDLAESWEISEDGKTYTFHLVRNATFHDGFPVTSADVKFSIENVVIPYHPLGKLIWAPLESIETPDDYTVVIKLKEAYSPMIFLFDMGEGGAPVIPKHLYENTDILKNPYNQKPIGSGPFKFVKWEKGNQAILERNENYFREGLPYLDKIIIRVMSEPNSIAIALENGDVHYAPDGFSLSDVERLDALKNVDVAFSGQRAYGQILSLVADLDHSILGDLKVRQAMAHAIDKNLIAERVYLGKFQPATSAVSSSISWAFNPNAPKYEFDPEKANRLLDEAGYIKDLDDKRFSIRLNYIAGNPDQPKVAEMVREQLRNVGIDVKIVPLDSVAYEDIVAVKRNFDLGLESWTTGPDPIMQVGQIFHSSQIGVLWGNSYSYKNERVDELFDAATYEPNQEKKAQLLYEVQNELLSDLPFIWLIELNPPAAYSKDFVGLPSTSLIPTERMERVWWTGGKSNNDIETIGTPTSSAVPVILAIVAAIGIGGGVGAYALHHRKTS